MLFIFRDLARLGIVMLSELGKDTSSLFICEAFKIAYLKMSVIYGRASLMYKYLTFIGHADFLFPHNSDRNHRYVGFRVRHVFL